MIKTIITRASVLGLAAACLFMLLDHPGTRAEPADPVSPPDEASLQRDIRSFLTRYCVDCHGQEVQKAGFAVHEIRAGDLGHWEKIAENVALELMPPPKRPQPTRAERDAVLAWIRENLKAHGIDEMNREQTSDQGNRVRHEDLFSGAHKGPAFSHARLWRISQRIYDSISSDLRATRGPAGRANGPVRALTGIESEAFKDYDLLRADDATVRAMMLNFRHLSSTIVRGPYKPGRFNQETNEVGPGSYDQNRAALRGLQLLTQPEPGPETYDQAVTEAFKLLLSREPNEGEHARYRKFLAESIAQSDPATGCENMVMAILMSPEFVFRMELGTGEDLGDGRRMLGPQELAYAIAYTLTDSPPDKPLRAALEEGRLKTRGDVEREVRRMLSVVDDRSNWHYNTHGWSSFTDWKPKHNPRLLRFFQEFFGYTKGDLVFKDEARNSHHFPKNLIRDADFLILHIIEEDRRVLETLLTTDRFIVAHTPPSMVESRLIGMKNWAKEHPGNYGGGALREGITPVLAGKEYRREATLPYGFNYWEWDYPTQQPFKVTNRVGFLTHPAWLVAWSGNFDNDIIRRGKWIREHLLADAIPELPIGVDAQLPEDPHKTLRQRMQVTRADACWRCHKQMDPLGMAFEAYDDFGRYRDGTIVLGDEVAHALARRKHREMRDRTLKEVWKLTANSPEARADRVALLQERIANVRPPEKDHPRHDEILEEIARNKEQWRGEIERLSAGPEVEQWAQQAEELRQKLAAMSQPQPEHSAEVDSAGVLTGTRDPELDGPYNDVGELMQRLAKSERVRQSFIRHIFRYFMGRNEMLSDSPTLMAMDKAYVDSHGSFKEVIITLMTSDSFLARRDKD